MVISNWTVYPDNRFSGAVTNISEARTYFYRRAVQMLPTGVEWSGQVSPLHHDGVEWGCVTEMRDTQTRQVYHSLYVYSGHEGQGHYTRWVMEQNPKPQMITHVNCDLMHFFDAKEILYRVVGHNTRWLEYRAVSWFYGARAAKRTGVPYMHHIDEGLAVLERIGASENACKAYCLHPIVQMDPDLSLAYETGLSAFTTDVDVIALALEYRNIANAGLRHRLALEDASEIALSPIKEVNDMLIADKVQNYKDFLLYHDGKHPDSADLHKYFRLWLERLGVSDEEFRAHMEFLDAPRQRLQSPVTS